LKSIPTSSIDRFFDARGLGTQEVRNSSPPMLFNERASL
jgi:hypothetical protein